MTTTAKIRSALAMFLVSTLMVGGAYWLQRAQHQKEIEAQQSYIQALETELKSIQAAMTQE